MKTNESYCDSVGKQIIAYNEKNNRKFENKSYSVERKLRHLYSFNSYILDHYDRLELEGIMKLTPLFH